MLGTKIRVKTEISRVSRGQARQQANQADNNAVQTNSVRMENLMPLSYAATPSNAQRGGQSEDERSRFGNDELKRDVIYIVKRRRAAAGDAERGGQDLTRRKEDVRPRNTERSRGDKRRITQRKVTNVDCACVLIG